MNTKNKILIGGLVLVVLSFYGGMRYVQSQIPVRNGVLTFGQNGTRANARGAFNSTGNTNGEIISKDSTSVTLITRDGSSKIIFLSNTTPIMKTVLGSPSDIVVGKEIIVMGTANADGSITAKNIQIQQATTTKQ